MLAYALAVALLVATPGPVVAVVLNTASRSGTMAAIRTAIGTNWASLVLIAVSSYILVTSYEIDPLILVVLSFFGCAYIGYIGWGMIYQYVHSNESHAPSSREVGGVWKGFLIGISNPKDIIFFISFFPQFIHVTRSLEASLVYLSLIWVVVDLTILFAYILFIAKLSRSSRNRVVEVISGLILILIALAGLFYNTRELLEFF